MNRFYYLTHVLGIGLAVIYVAVIAPKYKLDRTRSVLCITTAFATGYLLMKVLYYVFTGVWGGQNTVRLFVFVPVLVHYFSKLFRLDEISFADAVAPVVCITQAVAKIGCQYVGCCWSNLKVEWGIPNPLFLGEKLFPIQLTESVVSLIIVIVLIRIARKNKYECHGRQIPLMLILYGGTRFALEFLRDNEKIILGLSEFSLWSVIMVAQGIVLLVLLRKGIIGRGKKTNA